MIGRPIKIIMFGLLLTTSMIAVAHCADDAERPLVGDWAVAVGLLTSVGCPSRSDMERYYTLFNSGDAEAALTFAGSKNCTIVQVGTEVMVEDYSTAFGGGAYCVRPRGEPNCLWMLDVAVKSKAAVAKDRAAAEALAQKSDDRCRFETCKAGTRAVTYYKKTDPYYACPTRELATYVNSIVALASMQTMLGASMPNISDKTGEPEYAGETKTLVDFLREQAHVQTFDEAMQICTAGGNNLRVIVMNMPENSLVTYVFDEARKQAFWMPIAALGKR
jgi:hypothetical protein